VEAFERWTGSVRVVLYDNLKSVVLERQGDAIRFHPQILQLAAHYAFEPRPVAVARGNEKGRVERAIRYIREAFFAARAWSSLADLNAQADAWASAAALNRRWPQDPKITVRDALEIDRKHLRALPGEDALRAI
jgi:transposase